MHARMLNKGRNILHKSVKSNKQAIIEYEFT